MFFSSIQRFYTRSNWFLLNKTPIWLPWNKMHSTEIPPIQKYLWSRITLLFVHEIFWIWDGGILALWWRYSVSKQDPPLFILCITDHWAGSLSSCSFPLKLSPLKQERTASPIEFDPLCLSSSSLFNRRKVHRIQFSPWVIKLRNRKDVHSAIS